MDSFCIVGGRPLRGTVRVSGSKNAALPILIATLLTDEACVVRNVPTGLRDLRTTARLLEMMGKRVSQSGSTVRVEGRRRLKVRAPYELVKQMRASVLVAGPLLARFGEARVAMPGGCSIGLRPIDIHLKGFERMGAKVSYEHGDVVLRAKVLKPLTIPLAFPSVGATENLMMAAALVPGTTVLENAAREPEIGDLGDFLIAMGARVWGAGTRTVRVQGVTALGGAEHRVIPDRVEAGTFLIAAAATRGVVRVAGARPEHLEALLGALRRSGARVTAYAGGVRLAMASRPRPVSIATKPHPGFPTDLQAPWMAYMTLARGTSRVRETVFENRYMHAAELRRMGADIRVEGDDAVVRGVAELSGAPIMASDIRAGASLVVAALAARGRTDLHRVYHIDRGYEALERKLRDLRAEARRLRG